MSETQIVNIICETLEVSLEAVKSKRRFYELVTARGIISKILYSRGHNLQHIGRVLSKDHSTIIHYLQMIDNDIVHLPYVTNAWEQLKHLYVENKAGITTIKETRRKHSARKPLVISVQNGNFEA